MFTLSPGGKSSNKAKRATGKRAKRANAVGSRSFPSCNKGFTSASSILCIFELPHYLIHRKELHDPHKPPTCCGRPTMVVDRCVVCRRLRSCQRPADRQAKNT